VGTALLAIIAAIVVVVALSSSGRRIVTQPARAVAQTPAPAAPAPASTTSPPVTARPKHASRAHRPARKKAHLHAAAPPKVARVTPTPKPVPSAPIVKKTTNKPIPAPSRGAGTKSKSALLGAPIMLDTNASSVYNPYGYPSSQFGDPSLGIDSDVHTAWVAHVDPAIAPRLAAGFLIDLTVPHELRTLKLVTATPGMLVEIYGANGARPPKTITSGWTHLDPPRHVKRTQLFRLITHGKRYRWVLLWIPRVSRSSTADASAPTGTGTSALPATGTTAAGTTGPATGVTGATASGAVPAAGTTAVASAASVPAGATQTGTTMLGSTAATGTTGPAAAGATGPAAAGTSGPGATGATGPALGSTAAGVTGPATGTSTATGTTTGVTASGTTGPAGAGTRRAVEINEVSLTG
jgi:hypothetical protein